MISSRKQNNVDVAVQKLKSNGLNVTGVVCHVAKAEDRKTLLDTVINRRKNLIVDNSDFF